MKVFENFSNILNQTKLEIGEFQKVIRYEKNLLKIGGLKYWEGIEIGETKSPGKSLGGILSKLSEPFIEKQMIA